MTNVAPSELSITSEIDRKVVYDPVTDLNAKRTYFIEKSGSVNTYQPTNTTNYNNSQITWNVNVPSNEIIVDRVIYARVPMRFELIGPAPGLGNLVQLNQGLISLRSFPLNQCITSASLQLNAQSMSSQPYDYISALQHTNIYQKRTNIDMSSFPSLPDNCQAYSQLLGASTNVLNDFASSDYWQQGRGSFPMTVTAGSTGTLTTSAYIDTTIIEPIMISPLLNSPDQLENGLTYVNKFNLSLQLSTLTRMLSIDTANANPLTTVTASISGSPELLLRFITPSITEKIPPSIMYPYEEIVVQQSLNQTIAAGASALLTSNNYQLAQVPSRIYIYARRQDQDLQSATGYQYTDSFARIDSVNITFNNMQGLLGAASDQDLWSLSVRNGVNIPWDSWRGSGPTSVAESIAPVGVGSVLCVEPYRDFGLPPDLSNGVYGGQFNLLVKLNVTNIGPAPVTYSLFVVYVNDGVLTMVKGGTSYLQQGILTKEDVLDSPNLEKVPYQMAMTPWGGSFRGKLASFGQSLVHGLIKAAPYIKKGAEIASQFAPLLLAAGNGGASVGGKMVPASKVKSVAKSKQKMLTYR